MNTFICKMSGVMKRALPFIQVLAKSSPGVQKAIFKHGPSDLIMALCEIVLNVLKGVIELTPRQNRYMSRYKKQLRTLVRKDTAVKKKRRFLVQKGSGIFSILAPLALSMLTGG